MPPSARDKAVTELSEYRTAVKSAGADQSAETTTAFEESNAAEVPSLPLNNNSKNPGNPNLEQLGGAVNVFDSADGGEMVFNMFIEGEAPEVVEEEAETVTPTVEEKQPATIADVQAAIAVVRPFLSRAHRASYWLSNQQTKELVDELSTTGIPVVTLEGRSGRLRCSS